MSGYECLNRKFWRLSLTWHVKYMYAYLITSDEMHGLSGTGKPSCDDIQKDTGLPPRFIQPALDALVEPGSDGDVKVKRYGKWFWVVNKSLHSCASTTQWQGISNYFLNPKTRAPKELIIDYIEYYSDRPELDRLRALFL